MAEQVTAPTPLTAAGEWLALLDCGDDDHGDSVAADISYHRPLIQAAIEAEAVAAYKARLRERVEAIAVYPDEATGLRHAYSVRAAVIRIIEETE
jgi:hypothetical protein